MIILKLLIVFAVIFSANIVGSKIVEALPSFPPEILNQLLKNKSLINGILIRNKSQKWKKTLLSS
jgi:hypothetical protein